MKKALIICYYWPPAGGPGVQRWLKFVCYLKEFGIEPIVYVPQNPNYPLVDKALLEEVPQDITILKQAIKEPYRFATLFSKKKTKAMSSGIIKKSPSFIEKILLFIRGNFFIPDARIAWVKPSVSFLKNYLDDNPVNYIITSGPPHSLHLIGLKLQKKCNAAWIADFRDPWTTIHYHSSLQLTPWAKKRHKNLEYKVLNSANYILVTSQNTKKEFELITPKPIAVITNGFEPVSGIKPQLSTSFSIAHIGSLLSERNPSVLWEVLSEIASSNKQFSEDLELTFAGVVSQEIHTSLASFGLTKNVVCKGYVNHKEAIQMQYNAQVLLLLEIDSPETKAIIPGKLFEYLQAKRPIIALGPEGSNIEDILLETNSGHYFLKFQKEKLKEQILTYYSEFTLGRLQVASKNIAKFSRKNLTKSLATLLHSI